MNNFENRRDRFEFFESFENPLINMTFTLEVPDFRKTCRELKLPPFHYFLYHLFQSLNQVENFKYRIFEGKVIKIEELIPSYTVLNFEQNLNYTRFENTTNREEFIRRSLAAKVIGETSKALINTGAELGPREFKDYVFITSIPWLDFTSIQHPALRFKSADIPAIAWGKFSSVTEGMMKMPFSVQAHHGFVDGYHIHLLAEEVRKSLQEDIDSLR